MKKKDRLIGLFLSLPITIGLLVFFVIPFIITVYYSFTFGVGGKEFVGFANYSKVLSSAAFQLAAYNTIRFLLTAVPLNVFIGLLLALALYSHFGGTRLFRSILLFPMILPIASTVMVIQVFFANGGILNGILAYFGLPITDWLQGLYAFHILVGLYIWKNCGYNVILFLAGLNMIPPELYQTAEIDGASSANKFCYISFPLIVPTLFFVIVMSIINSFKTYREAFIIAGKHPQNEIYFLQHFLNNNFENLNYQRLAVATLLLFSIIFLFVGLLYWWQNCHTEDSL